MGSDIDDIDEAYRAVGGGGIATQEFVIRPRWWTGSQHGCLEMAGMVGQSVAFVWEASRDGEPSVQRIVVDRHGIRVTAVVRRLVPAQGSSAVMKATTPDPGWLEACVGKLRGRIDALRRFYGQG